MANPIITNKFTADPSVLQHKGTIYLYTGHDEAPPNTYDYLMNKWLCFSSADLHHWQEHPSPLQATDFKWAKGDAYASKIIERNGKFYWYAAVTHASNRGKAIGVAIADKPEGPYTDALGKPLITSDNIWLPGSDNFDPTVIIDDDEQAYIFWGKNICYYSALNNSMTALEGKINFINLPKFAEGAHIHKRNDWYYLSYGYGNPEKVAYAMSRNIHGPWEFKGILNEIPGNCETNRPAIIDFNGNSYFFYHNGALPGGGSHRRSVCIDRLYYEPDGSIRRVVMTSEGV